MKKSTLLSLATAGAIVATSAGTYAAWDKPDASTTANVNFRNPVTIDVTSNYSLLDASTATLNSLQTVTGDVTFTVTDAGELADTLTLVPTVSGGNSASVNDFTFEIIDKKNGKIDDHGTGKFVDTDITSTVYTVNVTPKDTPEAKAHLKDTAVQIKLTATLSKTQ